MIANAGMDVKKEKCSLLVEAQTSAAMTGINMVVPQKLSVYFAVIIGSRIGSKLHTRDLCCGVSVCKTLPVSRTEKGQALKAQAL